MKWSIKRFGVAAAASGALIAGVGVSPAQALVVGVCTMKANIPHGSKHVSGTINSEGTIVCSSAMDQINMQVWLEKENGQTWVSAKQTGPEKTRAAYANTSCSAGPAKFRTRMEYTLRAPAGTNPSYSYNNLYSGWQSVACGLARSLTPEPNAAEVSLQIVQTRDGSVVSVTPIVSTEAAA